MCGVDISSYGCVDGVIYSHKKAVVITIKRVLLSTLRYHGVKVVCSIRESIRMVAPFVGICLLLIYFETARAHSFQKLENIFIIIFKCVINSIGFHWHWRSSKGASGERVNLKVRTYLYSTQINASCNW